MSKTDGVLFELKMSFSAFLKSFFPFEYENKIYHLVDNYIASPWIKCDMCGNYPIRYVFVLQSRDGQKMHVGNKCIDLITNRNVSEWFEKFRTKLENVTRNRRFIDYLDSILTAYKSGKLPFQISVNDIDKLQEALDQMCDGGNLTRKQEQLAECYLSMNYPA